MPPFWLFRQDPVPYANLDSRPRPRRHTDDHCFQGGRLEQASEILRKLGQKLDLKEVQVLNSHIMTVDPVHVAFPYLVRSP